MFDKINYHFKAPSNGASIYQSLESVKLTIESEEHFEYISEMLELTEKDQEIYHKKLSEWLEDARKGSTEESVWRLGNGH